MNNQEIFNTVVNGLREQGCKSGYQNDNIEEFVCLYRDKDGNKCGAGWIIADEDYTKEMEGSSFNYKTTPEVTPRVFEPLVQKMGLTGENIVLIGHLQHIHDKHEVGEWEEQWVLLAKNFNLEIPVRLLESP